MEFAEFISLEEGVTPAEVQRIEAELLNYFENGRVAEEIKTGRRFRLHHQGFARAGSRLEGRARLEELSDGLVVQEDALVVQGE